MLDVKLRYSDEDLQEFRVIIEQKITRAEADLASLESSYKNNAGNGTDDTSPSFKSFDEGSSFHKILMYFFLLPKKERFTFPIDKFVSKSSFILLVV